MSKKDNFYTHFLPKHYGKDFNYILTKNGEYLKYYPKLSKMDNYYPPCPFLSIFGQLCFYEKKHSKKTLQ